MSGRKRYRVDKPAESIYTEDIVEIMKNGNGPFLKKDIWQKLGERHPHLSPQELKNHTSYAFYYDRYVNDKKKIFYMLQQGSYDLNHDAIQDRTDVC